MLTIGLVPRLRDASVVKFQNRMGDGKSEDWSKYGVQRLSKGLNGWGMGHIGQMGLMIAAMFNDSLTARSVVSKI